MCRKLIAIVKERCTIPTQNRHSSKFYIYNVGGVNHGIFPLLPPLSFQEKF